MLTARQIVDAIAFCVLGHDRSARKPEFRFRTWDNETPYGVHPVWCAMTVLFETSLPKRSRVFLVKLLLFHDLEEDTTAGFPEDTEREVVDGVYAMTRDPGAPDETEAEIRATPGLLQVARLADKTCNWMDGVQRWDSNKRARKAAELLLRAQLVEREFGELHLVRFARALCA